MIKFVVLILSVALSASAIAQSRGGPSNDIRTPGENYRPDSNAFQNEGNSNTTGRTPRTDAGGIPCNATINPAQKTLVLIVLGASNGASIGPSAYVPTNINAIDNFNLYDGCIYQPLDPFLGQTQSALGTGSIAPRVADQFITNAVFDRVIIVSGAVGGATALMYAPGGTLYNRGCAMLTRLKDRGITPGTPGVTMAAIFFMGENDGSTGTSPYQAAIVGQVAKMQSCGFSGRVFIPTETIIGNATISAIQAAQANLVALGAPYYAGGNIDSLTGATNRQGDGTHLTATGQGSASTLVYNAMRASGSPF